jgi:glyoxylase-like metal-dependent hydrolase (beta-lactamase superfamily II)
MENSTTIEITPFITGPIETNTYVVSNREKKCCIVDPSGGCGEMLRYIEGASLDPCAIILTHGHFDHLIGIPEVLRRFPEVSLWAHPLDFDLIKRADLNGSPMIGIRYEYNGPLHGLTEGAMRIGGFECTVFHIPGHTPGGCALLFDGHLLSGDSLFAGSVGRTDWEYCDTEALIRSIKEKLLPLPDNTVVHPGHMGRTTIGRERRMNPFLHD